MPPGAVGRLISFVRRDSGNLCIHPAEQKVSLCRHLRHGLMPTGPTAAALSLALSLYVGVKPNIQRLSDTQTGSSASRVCRILHRHSRRHRSGDGWRRRAASPAGVKDQRQAHSDRGGGREGGREAGGQAEKREAYLPSCRIRRRHSMCPRSAAQCAAVRPPSARLLSFTRGSQSSARTCPR